MVGELAWRALVRGLAKVSRNGRVVAGDFSLWFFFAFPSGYGVEICGESEERETYKW